MSEFRVSASPLPVIENCRIVRSVDRPSVVVDIGISPLFGDVSGLAPLFTVDNSETLLDDSSRLVDRCRAVGGRAELQRNAGLFHVWPITVPYVREARRTAADVVRFLDHEVGLAPAISSPAEHRRSALPLDGAR